MVTVGPFVPLEAKPGREDDVRSFGIFDGFPDEAGRQAHLAVPVTGTLMARGSETLAEPPTIAHIDAMASKLPRS